MAKRFKGDKMYCRREGKRNSEGKKKGMAEGGA